jgi:predicted transposase YdaD
MGDFDTTLRHLAVRRPAAFVWLALREEPVAVEPLPRSLPRQATEADIVLRVDDSQGRRFVLHVEVERGPPGDIGPRLLEYNVLLHRRHGLPVRSVLVLLEGAGPGRELTAYGYGAGGPESLSYSYTVVRLQGLEPAELASECHPLLLALTPLARGGTDPGALDRAVQAIRAAGLPPEERADALTAMTVLGGVHGTRELLYSLVRRAEMKDSVIYQDILEEGRVEGRAEGRAEDILRVLARRLGEVPASLQARVRACTDLDTLDRWLDLAVDAATVAEFERALR